MNKVILITGASAGIGKEAAKQLLQAGNVVYGAARRFDKMSDIEASGVRVLQMDVTNEQSMVAGVNSILKAEGRIDVLINNAGFGAYGAVEEVPMSEAKYQMEVNVFGAARLIQLVLPSMIDHHFGKIVNISSISGKFALPLGAWYHASKFAFEALSDSLRNEVKQFGVDVIVIEPGAIKTEWANIATENLLKVSGQGRYKQMTEDFAKMIKSMDDSTAGEPKLIANLIKEVITTEQPETRYAAGYMAEELLSMRKTMTDREFDDMLSSLLNRK
ncbi:oxidoreductase [Telluribacter sp.]|jgi:short-subunit dehydrogenase|uniref:oxidoreductase n=1 Tax=Telluribacter sp. TaxID=1978767 RepID=UPI002E0FDDB0|nr:oxidoreductase [Telluribacter sp.]